MPRVRMSVFPEPAPSAYYHNYVPGDLIKFPYCDFAHIFDLDNQQSDIEFFNGLTGLLYPVFSDCVLPPNVINHIKSYLPKLLMQGIDRWKHLAFGGHQICRRDGACASGRLGFTSHVEVTYGITLDKPTVQEKLNGPYTLVWGRKYLCKACRCWELYTQAQDVATHMGARIGTITTHEKHFNVEQDVPVDACRACGCEVWIKTAGYMSCASCFGDRRKGRPLKRPQVLVLLDEDD